MRWRWSGTMNRIGEGVVEADTKDEALRQAKDDLCINGAPGCEISVEPIEEGAKDYDNQ